MSWSPVLTPVLTSIYAFSFLGLMGVVGKDVDILITLEVVRKK